MTVGLSLLLASPICAQTKSNVPNAPIGYKGGVDIGFSWIPDSSGAHTWDLSTTHGYQVNPYLFVGGGIGFSAIDAGSGFYFLPIFASLSGNIPVGKNFYSFGGVRLGYSLDRFRGTYAYPHIGCTYMFDKSKLGLDFMLGYTIQRISMAEANLNSLSIKVGLRF